MAVKELEKKKLTELIDFLMKTYEVIAPVKKKNFHVF
jgi:hypothetical protein